MHSRVFTLRPTARSVADKPISSLQVESTKTWQHRVQNIIKYKVINYKNIIKCLEKALIKHQSRAGESMLH